MSPVVKYFSGEKAESYLFILLGVLGFVAGIYLILTSVSIFWKGFAIPFILVSALELIVGVTLIYRSPKDIIRVEGFINNEPKKITTEEIPRMKKVMRKFIIFRYIEIALILTGIIIYFTIAQIDFWKGLGLALFIQASIVLTLDYFAEKRGFVYLEFLNLFRHE